MSSVVPGGWTGFKWEIPQEAKAVFDKALAGFVGVGYTPYAVATQVVAGTNYCFICKGVVVVPELPETAVKLYIYQPLSGDPVITQIVEIKP